jgi:UDP-2-acetamido-3-amino-2,3-dideoxy-glucuronate N-acetyltransferase
LPSDPAPFVHPTAVVDPGASLGAGSKVWHFSHVMAGARVGAGCSLGQNCFVGKGVVLGRGCRVQNNVSLYEGVTLEDEVFCGPSVVFTNVVNPRSAIPRKSEFRPTLVRKGATLGANSTLLCGITIGRYAFVGAGAVVTKGVPDHALVVGVPARRAGWMCACGVRLGAASKGRGGRAGFACAACGARYRKGDGGLVPA